MPCATTFMPSRCASAAIASIICIPWFAINLIISGFAYAQLTPMPLLGFGANSIIGYFLLAGLVRRVGEGSGS